MLAMTDKWQRLADQVVRRRGALGLTQAEVAHRGPLSLDRVQAIEGARSSKYRAGTIAALERALEWAYGSVQAILAGGEPTPLEAPKMTDSARATDQLSVEREPTARDVADQMTELANWLKVEREHDRERIRRLEEEVERLRKRQSG